MMAQAKWEALQKAQKGEELDPVDHLLVYGKPPAPPSTEAEQFGAFSQAWGRLPGGQTYGMPWEYQKFLPGRMKPELQFGEGLTRPVEKPLPPEKLPKPSEIYRPPLKDQKLIKDRQILQTQLNSLQKQWNSLEVGGKSYGGVWGTIETEADYESFLENFPKKPTIEDIKGWGVDEKKELPFARGAWDLANQMQKVQLQINDIDNKTAARIGEEPPPHSRATEDTNFF